MFNPRWPHTLTVISRSLDSRGRPVTDENGEPVNSTMTLQRVVGDIPTPEDAAAESQRVAEEVLELLREP